jgi:AAT family amino acid transporter
MEKFIMEKRIKHPVLSGLATVALLVVVASVFWVVWSNVWKMVILLIGGSSVAGLSPEVQGHFLKESVEGTFFWLVISTWVWFTLSLGNFGKNKKSTKQPITGLRYTGMALVTGAVAFAIFVSLLGIWWEPFSLQVLFRPVDDTQALLAIKGWSAINFFTLAVILAQIPITSLFGRYPFSKYSKEDWSVGFGTLFLGLFVALLVWMFFILPSFFTLQVDGVTPAEGGEGYPQKLITTKQPWSGLIGLGIALTGAFTMLPILRNLLTPLAESVGILADLAVASFALTIINVMLAWHHHFDDYPNQEVMTSALKRILLQFAVVIVVGSVLGILWIKYLHIWPFGANDLGLGHPMLGILGGQFVYMLPMVFMNTFFDKWPMAKSVKEK